MSGILGIASADPELLNPRLLRELTETMRFRGPDACETWTSAGVGLGHTLLRTTDDTAPDRQPCTLDGDCWITADARVDRRAELVAALAHHGEIAASGATDAHLLLHAYRAWRERCVDHVRGDFAFGIWDRRERRLFCARDHFGVRPFYYAEPPGALVFSNTLECVRRHPGVGEALDDLSIADFLLFKYSQRQEATAFEMIRRLAPGHTLTWTPGSPAVTRQYWTLSMPPELRYRDPRDYVARFQEIFRRSVADRLRTRRVAVSMSGGLDSSAIAAAARSELAAGAAPFELRAHTMVFDRAVPDEERRFGGAVAARLGIPVDFFVADDYPAFAAPSDVPHELPEPGDSTFRTLGLDFHARIAAGARVVFSGLDADTLLNELTPDHFAALARRRRFGQLAGAMARYVRVFRRRPPLGVRRALATIRGTAEPAPALPAWINPDLARRLDLGGRVRAVAAAQCPPAGAALRPRATRMAATTMWATVFSWGDAEWSRQPLEFRYPFADVELVGYLLAIPAVPWCTDKSLLREALKGVLPEEVRRRGKSPMAVDPLRPALRQAQTAWVDAFESAPALDRYVNRRAVPPITGETGDDVYVNLRPLCLSRWLDRQLVREDMKHVTRSEDARDIEIVTSRRAGGQDRGAQEVHGA